MCCYPVITTCGQWLYKDLLLKKSKHLNVLSQTLQMVENDVDQKHLHLSSVFVYAIPTKVINHVLKWGASGHTV